MWRKSTFAAVGIAVVIAATGAGQQSAVAQGIHPANRGCLKLYKQWQAAKQHKAFAIANGTNIQSCGVTWGYPSKEAAVKAANEWCRKVAQGEQCYVSKSE